MKRVNLGRLELLSWLNELTECDYSRIEMCCDAVGYCQVIDAIHPNVIQLSKLNFNARFQDDFTKNLKVLDAAFSKLEIDYVVPIQKLSLGKFQDNNTFLQWLYNYALKNGPFASQHYQGYEIRQNAMKKHKNKQGIKMNSYLIPNNAILKFKSSPSRKNELPQNNLQQYESNQQYGNQINQQYYSNHQDNKLQQIDQVINNLEQDFKSSMEYNWKLMYAIDDMLYQRNTLHDILQKIDREVLQNFENDSESKQLIQQIISHTPDDFQKSN